MYVSIVTVADIHFPTMITNLFMSSLIMNYAYFVTMLDMLRAFATSVISISTSFPQLFGAMITVGAVI